MRNKNTFGAGRPGKALLFVGALGLAAATVGNPAFAGDRRLPAAHRHQEHVQKHRQVSKKHRSFPKKSLHFEKRQARHPHHYRDRGHRHVDSLRHQPSRLHRRSFVVPVRLPRASVETYRPFYDGRIYHRPHRHDHAIYRFPVLTGTSWVLRPHYYCDGVLYRGDVAGHVTYRGPRVHLRVGF